MLSVSLLLALAAAQAGPGTAGDIVRARDYCYRQQYDSALATTSAIIARDPTDPAGYYWKASAIQLLIFDSGRIGLADSFFALSDRAVALCRQRLERDPDDGRAQFYHGMTQLNRASFLGWQQRMVPAFRTLLQVAPRLNAALADDSTLTDARFGLGMIEYFKASSSRYTLGLRLLGSRKKAYATVRPLADGDGLLKPAAEVMLAFMLKEDGEYESALGYCRRLLAAYPGNRSVLRMTRDALFTAGRYSEAVATGSLLEKSIPAAFPDNRYGISENWIVCGKAYARMGMRDSAVARFDRVLSWEPYQQQVPWLATYVREARQWKKKLAS